MTLKVFIAYKRATAEDFARHLKKGLKAENIQAFLDVEDIPQASKGTDAWWKLRDAGVQSSNVFLLIITDSVENSLEVKKEIVLGRKVEDMRFVFLRHEGLKPEIVFDLEGEEFNEGDFNQVSFDTKQDLLRKVLRILRRGNSARELIDVNLDPMFSHVEARLFYPPDVRWDKNERNSHKNHPRLKLILVTDLRKSYWVGKYAWNLILNNKIRWFSLDEQDLEEWCKKEGYTLERGGADKDDLLEPFFEAEIVDKRTKYRQGEVVLFRTHYRGELTNGFFDNQVLLPSGVSAWVWAPDTLKDGYPNTKGKLNGYVNHISNWSWGIPSNAPLGEYLVYMRVYNHFGVNNRPVIKERREIFNVVSRTPHIA